MNKTETGFLQNTVKSILLILLGTATAAFALVCLLKPMHMAPGGIAALSAMIADVTPLSIGVIMLMFNVPLFLASLKMNRNFFVKSILGAVSYSVFADVFSAIHIQHFNPVLHAVFGGSMMGFGFGLVFLAGGSSGGTDILGWLLHRKAPLIKIGKAVLIFDMSIIIIQAVVYNSVESALFAATAMFLSSRVIDYVIEGTAQSCKTAYIISEEYEKISYAIIEKLGRGVTALDGHGMYTGDNKKVLMCTFYVKQLPELKKIISEVDSHAFVFFSDAREVFGVGFETEVNKGNL